MDFYKLKVYIESSRPTGLHSETWCQKKRKEKGHAAPEE